MTRRHRPAEPNRAAAECSRLRPAGVPEQTCPGDCPSPGTVPSQGQSLGHAGKGHGLRRASRWLASSQAQTSGLTRFPAAVLVRHADGAGSIPGGDRRCLVREEHAMLDDVAFREPAKRRRAVEPAVDLVTAMSAQRAGQRREHFVAIGTDEAVELSGRHTGFNAVVARSVRHLKAGQTRRV
jgi:hypothetical protein